MSLEPDAAVSKVVCSDEGAVWLSDESLDNEDATDEVSNAAGESTRPAKPSAINVMDIQEHLGSPPRRARPASSRKQKIRRKAVPAAQPQHTHMKPGHQYDNTSVHDHARVLQGNYHNHNITIVATTNSGYSSPTMAYAASLLGSATGSFAYAAAKDYYTTPVSNYDTGNPRQAQRPLNTNLEAHSMPTAKPRLPPTRSPARGSSNDTSEYSPTMTREWKPIPEQVPMSQEPGVHQFIPGVRITNTRSLLSRSRALVADDLRTPPEPTWKPISEEMIDRGRPKAARESSPTTWAGAQFHSLGHDYGPITIQDCALAYHGDIDLGDTMFHSYQPRTLSQHDSGLVADHGLDSRFFQGDRRNVSRRKRHE